MDIDEQPQTPTSCFLSFIRALDCLYSLVMLASRTLEIDEVASSHLKHALKGEPETVAVTLGKSFRLAAVASTQFSNARKTTDLQHLLYVFPAILDLWDLRSNRRVDTDSGSSNVSFAPCRMSEECHALTFLGIVCQILLPKCSEVAALCEIYSA